MMSPHMMDGAYERARQSVSVEAGVIEALIQGNKVSPLLVMAVEDAIRQKDSATFQDLVSAVYKAGVHMGVTMACVAMEEGRKQ